MSPKDNTTFTEKVTLRKHALNRLRQIGITDPVIMETHGGEGKIFNVCYAHLKRGVVFEKDAEKTAILGQQRPNWAVYEGDCVEALKAGVGGHLVITLLDVDPYGESWDVIEAFFASERPFADVMAVAVNDGGRQNLTMHGAWRSDQLRPMVERYGNDLHPIYLEVCSEMLESKVAPAGYVVDHFGGYYCGVNKQLTHYMAMLRTLE